MSTLAERQLVFMRAILNEDAPLPHGWGNSQAAGMAVYRGNYRGALMRAMEETFERTRAYVGDAPFRRVAARHLIAHPPAGWTIDEAGEGFDATCAKRFADNPEVAELAWIEWAMLQLATAADCAPITPQEFAQATADFGDAQWMALTLKFQPRATARLIDHDLMPLWNALGDESREKPELKRDGPFGCLVWREGERPRFTTVDASNARAFAAMQSGASYGEVIELIAGDDPDDAAVHMAAMQAGAMLGEWLKEGMITALA